MIYVITVDYHHSQFSNIQNYLITKKFNTNSQVVVTRENFHHYLSLLHVLENSYKDLTSLLLAQLINLNDSWYSMFIQSYQQTR